MGPLPDPLALPVTDDSDLTLLTVLDHRAATTPDSTFIEFMGETVTFADLSGRVDRVATAWLQMGLAHGDRVGIASRNSVDWLVAYLATVRVGAVLVTLSIMYREREFTHMLGQSGARVLLCESAVADFDFQAFLSDLRPQLPSVEQFVFFGTEQPALGHGWTGIAATPADPVAVAAAFDRVRATDPAVILYTSGTTGQPKGATLTHRSLLGSAVGQVERYAQGPDDTMLGVMPFNHVGGLTCTVGSSLVSGGAVALLPGFHPDLVAEVIARGHITLFAGVPTMYTMLLASETFAAVDTSRIRTCVVGGSNLEPALAERVRAAFPSARLSNLYGLSETSGASVISHPDDSPDLVDTTIGTPIGDVQARIVDDSGDLVPPGSRGRTPAPRDVCGGRLLGHARRDPEHVPARRVAGDRRHGHHDGGRPHHHPRPQEGDVRPGWLQRVPGRDRERPVHPPVGRPVRRDRVPGPDFRGEGLRVHRPRTRPGGGHR
ncbi:class I adenylate-forming enzyme family protein [Dietzia sp. NPDC055877]